MLIFLMTGTSSEKNKCNIFNEKKISWILLVFRDVSVLCDSLFLA